MREGKGCIGKYPADIQCMFDTGCLCFAWIRYEYDFSADKPLMLFNLYICFEFIDGFFLLNDFE
jgi:hypothetical protein